MHYACIRFKPIIARELIIYGGIIKANGFVKAFGSTALKCLVYDKQYQTAKCYVESGCNLNNEKWILNEPFTIGTKLDEEFITWLREYVKKPPKLINLCRKNIRACLINQNLHEKIKQLNIPYFLKEYLMMKF